MSKIFRKYKLGPLLNTDSKTGTHYYLRQGGYVFVGVCQFVSRFAQKQPNGFGWNFQEGWQWAEEQLIKFLVTIRIRVPHTDPDPYPESLRRSLAEVCTVPVLLVTTGLVNLHIIINSTQQRITDAGVWKSTSLMIDHQWTLSLHEFFWSVCGTSQIGCEMKFNCLLLPKLIRPCSRCINSASVNKTIVDYTWPTLCTPVTPFPTIAMQAIVNMPEDRTTDIGNMHKNLVKIARVVLEISCRTASHARTHTHTHIQSVAAPAK